MEASKPQETLEQQLVRAMQWHVQGRLDMACDAYQALLQQWPGQPDTLLRLSMLHMSRQDWPAAVKTLGILIKSDAANREALGLFYQLAANAGTLCSEQMDELVTAAPNNLALRAAAAGLYLVLALPEKELLHLEALYKQGVRTEPFCLQYATALRNGGQIARAMQICNKALAASPNSIMLLKLRGDLFLTELDAKNALKDFERCMALSPGDHHARLKVGSTKLLLSDCKEGFEEFSAHRDIEIANHKLNFTIPEWKAEPLAGKRLLIWDSQGIGDIIMFSAFIPWVLEQKAKVTLALYPKLMALFARSFPEAEITLLSADIAARYSANGDYHIPAGQLLAKALPDYIPAHHLPFLKPDETRVKALREKYQSLAPEKKLIGISWHTTNADTSNQRSIPLAEWAPLLALPNIQWVSLQYGNHAAQIQAMANIHNDPAIDAFADIDGLAAQIAAMDEVITIDNTTIHLAGALGVPATLLLSAPSNWRWGFGHKDCRWYKSVTIERQEKLFQWQPVIERLRAKLTAA